MGKQKKDNFWENMVAGGVSGAVSKTISSPFERVRFILETQDFNDKITSDQRSKGILKTFSRIMKQEGFFSFWRGNVTNLVRYVPNQAMNFAIKDYIQSFNKYDKNTQFISYFVANIFSGSIAGLITRPFVYPFFVFRTRLAVDYGTSRTREFRFGSLQMFWHICKNETFESFFKGFSSITVALILYRSIYFGGYDTGKDFIPIVQKNVYIKWIYAQLISMLAHMVVQPIDLIARRLMIQAGQRNQKEKYRGFFHALKTIYKEEGASSFYKGGLTGCYRVISASLTLVLYDEYLALKNGGNK